MAGMTSQAGSGAVVLAAAVMDEALGSPSPLSDIQIYISLPAARDRVSNPSPSGGLGVFASPLCSCRKQRAPSQCVRWAVSWPACMLRAWRCAVGRQRQQAT